MSESSGSAAPARWEKTGRTLHASCQVFDVLHARFRHPGRGRERDFVVIDAPDWVNVIALTPEHRLVLVRQFRFGIDDFSLEIPARVLGTVHPNPAIMNNVCHLVLVEEAERTAALSWDHDEEIEVLTAPVNEVLAWARTGRIRHALVLDALLLFEPVWERLRAGAPG